MSTDRYIGTWILVPDLCIYQNGMSPVEGEYTISGNSEGVNFQVFWKDRNGRNHELHFGGPLDGKKHPAKVPGLTDIAYERIGERTLDSTAFDRGKTVMYSRRVASSDGELLAVVQTVYGADGALSNFQVYRRKNS